MPFKLSKQKPTCCTLDTSLQIHKKGYFIWFPQYQTYIRSKPPSLFFPVGKIPDITDIVLYHSNLKEC